MTDFRDNPKVAERIAESTAWVFRKLMEAEAIQLEKAARELYVKEEQDANTRRA